MLCERRVCSCQYPTLLFLLSNKSPFFFFRVTMHLDAFPCFLVARDLLQEVFLIREVMDFICFCFAAWNLPVIVRALVDTLYYKNQDCTFRNSRSKNRKKLMEPLHLSLTASFKNSYMKK